MAIARILAVRTAFRAARTTRPALSKPQTWQRIGRRNYASGGHGAVKSSSDLPWAAGSLVTTALGCAYLLSGEKPQAGHGHDDHHGEKHEEHEDAAEEPEEDSKEEGESEESKDESKEDSEEESKEESKEEPKDDSKDGAKGEQESDDSGSDDDAQSDTPATSDDESDGKDKNTKQHIQDSKGGNKKRLESNKSVKQGEEKDTEKSSTKDKAAASKEPGGKNTTSGKQEGLTNTDTKHSLDAKDEGQSMKGEGIPDSAKAKGTVDPKRSQDDE